MICKYCGVDAGLENPELDCPESPWVRLTALEDAIRQAQHEVYRLREVLERIKATGREAGVPA